MVTNFHFMGGVELGDGNNKLVNGNIKLVKSGKISGGVIAGSSNDTLQNAKGLITGDVLLGDGNNTLTNSGELDDNYFTGTGTDIVTNTGAGFIRGEVDLGAGNDAYTGGSKRDQVSDHDGADSYSLNGGDDIFDAAHPNLDGNDTVNGGAGRDLYDASGATSAVFINLDTLTHAERVYRGQHRLWR